MAESLFMEAKDDAKLERYLRHYDDIFESYNVKTSKATGMQTLRFIGMGEVDFRSYHETARHLGSCAIANVPNYTALYFTEELELPVVA